MSAAAQEALAEPVGLFGCAAVAASGLRECCRSGGCVVCACCQWSSGHPRQGTLVRHFMCGVLASAARDVDAVTLSGSQRSALTPALGPRGVPHASTARALVATGGLAPGEVVSLAPAGAVAIPVAAIATAAQHDLDAAPGAQEQSSWTVQLHHQAEPVVLDGVVPARHTAAAPPSSARCGARRGHQAARRERAAAAPTFFGIGRLYRASRRSLQVKQAPTTASPSRRPRSVTTPLRLAYRYRLRPRLPGRPAGRPGRRTPHRSVARLEMHRDAHA